jgi:signal transduction histidine kinase/ligand-binding sensor domain-containing protein
MALASVGIPPSDPRPRSRVCSPTLRFLPHFSRLAAALLAGSWFLCSPSAAQPLPPAVAEYHHTQWLLRDGLPGSRVQGLLQSADGYLWFSTLSGLVRFDGVRFASFDGTGTPALRGADAYPTRPLLVDRRGVMWVGTSEGLVQYARGEFRRVGGPEVAGMAEDAAGRLWAYAPDATGGLLLMRNGRMERADVRPALPAGVNALAVQGENVWVATADGTLFRVSPGPGLSLTRSAGIRLDGIVSVLRSTRDGTLWIGTEAGFSRLKDGVLHTHPLGPGGRVYDVTEGPDGSVWLGTEDQGLLRWKEGRITSYARQAFQSSNLTDNLVLSLLVDREGSLWAGTAAGLDQFHATDFLTFGPGDGFPANTAGPLHVDAEGMLWVAPKEGGLLRGTPGAFSQVAPDALAGVRVLAIRPDGEGGMLLASTDGVLRYRDGRIVRRYPVPGRWTIDVLQDRRGRLWLATRQGGVQRLDGGRVRTFGAADGLAENRVCCLLEDRDGSVWVATGNGISRISGDSVVSYREPGLRGGLLVLDMRQDSRGRLWLGTLRGLARVVGGHIVVLGPAQGLPAEVVGSVIDDGAGNLWLGKGSGILRVPADAAAAATEGRQATVPARRYGVADGLVTWGVVWPSHPSSFRGADGRLWFSAVRGLVMLDPRRVIHNPVPPLVSIEELRVDGRQVPARGAPDLPANVGRVELRFAGLSLRAPQLVRFRYMLEGYDRDWMDAGTMRMVSYTRLNPGDYRFRLSAANEDGVWSPQGAVLSFHVRPSWYETSWFYLLATLAAATAVWGVVRLRQRVLERRFALVLEERTRMAREIHDTLLQGFTGITLQLHTVQRLVAEAPARAQRQIARLLELADQTLREARHAVWDMRMPGLDKGILATAVADMARDARTPGRETVFRLTGTARHLAPATETALLRIGREALANAVSHAAARRIDVELAYGRREVRLVVRDDGRGFDPAAAPPAAHWGLVGMRERAEAVGARLLVRSAPGEGTEVSVIAPGRRPQRATAGAAPGREDGA